MRREERWLRTEVAEAFDAVQRAPDEVIPAADVAAKLRRHHANRLKTERAAGAGNPA